MGPPITPPPSDHPSTASSPSPEDSEDESEIPFQKIKLGNYTQGASNPIGSTSTGQVYASRKARIKIQTINKYPKESPTPTRPQRPVHSISGSFLPHFTGRKDDIHQISTILATSDDNGRTPSYCIMWGMAGVGKTALVHQYMDRVPKHISIIWLKASTAQTLDRSISTALEKCYPQDRKAHRDSDEKERRDKLKIWLEFDSLHEDQEWILVLDDVRDKTCRVVQEDIVPTRGPTCKVIITTRSRLIAEDLIDHVSRETYRCWEVKVLDTESAVELFKKIWSSDPRNLGKGKILNEMEKSKITDILNTIGNLPLAVEMAAKYAKMKGLDSAWEARGKALTWRIEIPHYKDHPRYKETPLLENVFDFFFDLKQNPRTAEADLVDNLSFYNPTSISVRLFEKPVEVLQSVREPPPAPKNSLFSLFWPLARPEITEKHANSSSEMTEMLKRLERLSYLTQQAGSGRGNYLSIHKLVQDLSRKKLREELNSSKYTWQRRSKRIEAEIERLHHAMEHPAERFGLSKDFIQCKEILSHIVSILKFIDDVDEDSDIVAEKIFQPLKRKLLRMQETVVLWLWEGGQYEHAAGSARELFPSCQKIWGPDHPVTLRMRNVKDLRYQGHVDTVVKFEAAGISKTIEKLQKRGKTLEDESDLVSHLDNYAALLRSQGRYTEAFRQCENARDARQKLSGSRSALRDHDNFALVYQCLGLYSKAREHSGKALEEREQTLPSEHIDTLACLHQYASILYCQGLYADAKSEIERALEGRLRLLGHDWLAATSMHRMQDTLARRRLKLGDNHPDTLSSQDRLALIYLGQGKLNTAREKAEGAYERRQKVLGQGHPDTLTSLRNLASIYRQGPYAIASRTLDCLSDKAWIHFIHGNFASAELEYEDLRQRQERILRDRHPDTLATVTALSLVSLRLGKYKEAKAAIYSTLMVQIDVLGSTHPETLANIHNYSVVLRHQGLYEDAESLSKQALEARQQILGDQHPDFLASLENYALVLRCLGHYGRAEEVSKQALHGRQLVFGNDHPETLQSIDIYATILQSLYKDKEAEFHIKFVLNHRRESLVEDHSDRLLSRFTYVWTLLSQGDLSSAQVISRDVLEKRRKAKILPDVMCSAEQLGRILLQEGRCDEAAEFLSEAFEGRKEVLGKEHSDTLSSLAFFCLALVQLKGPSATQRFLKTELATEEVPDIGQTRFDSLSNIKHTARVLSSHLTGTLTQLKVTWAEAGERLHADQARIVAAKRYLKLGRALDAEKKLQSVCTHPDEPSLLALALLMQGRVSKQHAVLSLEDLSRIPARAGKAVQDGRDITADVEVEVAAAATDDGMT